MTEKLEADDNVSAFVNDENDGGGEIYSGDVSHQDNSAAVTTTSNDDQECIPSTRRGVIWEPLGSEGQSKVEHPISVVPGQDYFAAAPMSIGCFLETDASIHYDSLLDRSAFTRRCPYLRPKKPYRMRDAVTVKRSWNAAMGPDGRPLRLEEFRTTRPITIMAPRFSNSDDIVKMFSFEGKPETILFHYYKEDSPGICINKSALQLDSRQTYEKFMLSMIRILHVRDRLRYIHHNKEAVLAGMYALQHRVLMLSENEFDVHHENLQGRKWNALQSFGCTVTGKWCFPEGDLLLFPGIDDNLGILSPTIWELTEVMADLRQLEGTFQPGMYARKLFKQSKSSKGGRVKFHHCLFIDNLHEMSSVFRPVFTRQYYFMGGLKPRVAVELYQYGVLVFMKLAEWCLAVSEFGAALCFVQHMQLCVENMYNILPEDRERNSYYTYTITQWFTGKCYHALAQVIHDASVRTQYRETMQNSNEFVSKFYLKKDLELFSPLPSNLAFPTNLNDCLTKAYYGYSAISVPRSWTKSLFEQETSAVRFYLNELSSWFGELFTRGRKVLHDSTDFVTHWNHKRDLEQLCQKIMDMRTNNANLDYNVAVLSLTAKSSKFLSAWYVMENMSVQMSKESRLRIKPELPDYTHLAMRRLHQYHAMRQMNEDCRGKIPDCTRTVLIKMAKKTMFDEVIYSLEVFDYEFNDWGMEMMMLIFPSTLEVWFRREPPLEMDTVVIPEKEMASYNQIMAMYFYGLGIAYLKMYLNRNEGDMSSWCNLENARYLYALSVVYLSREEVTYVLVKAFMEHTIVRRALMCKYVGPGLKNNLRKVFHVIRLLLPILPILYEYYINTGMTGGPKEYGKVRLSHVEKTIEIDDVFFHSTNSKATYENIINYLRNDLTVDIEKSYVALPQICPTLCCTDTSSSETLKLRKLTFQALTAEHAYLTSLHTIVNDPRPNLQGRDDCLNRNNCPLEPYIEEQERFFQPPKRYNESFYDKVFQNVSEPLDDPKSDCDKLINKLGSNLMHLLDVAIVELRNLERRHNYCRKRIVIQSAYSRTADRKIKASFLKSELRLILADLKAHYSSMLVTTVKALYKLDALLNLDEGFTLLLRGFIEN